MHSPMNRSEGELVPPIPDSHLPLSQRSASNLRSRSDEMRQMAQSATTQDVKAALLRLADDFEKLAAERETQGKP